MDFSFREWLLAEIAKRTDKESRLLAARKTNPRKEQIHNPPENGLDEV